MEWEEQYVLLRRKVTIDQNIIFKAAQDFVNKIYEYFTKYGLDNNVTFDMDKNIITMPDNTTISFRFYENDEAIFETTRIIDEKTFIGDKKAQIICNGGVYLLWLINGDKREASNYFELSTDLINQIFRHLLFS